MAARQWTIEQRKQQSLKIRQWHPWQHSTGAKTLEGKAIASHNAFKGGFRATLQSAARYLREHKQFINEL